jgi:sRNA-binding regulator protein Hfq
MPSFYCPICNHKSFTEKDEKEHAKTHQKPGQPIEPGIKKPEEQKKEIKIPNIIIKFLHKNVSIALIDGSKISGKLTEFNNYDLLLDDKILIPKHAMITMQEVEAKP